MARQAGQDSHHALKGPVMSKPNKQSRSGSEQVEPTDAPLRKGKGAAQENAPDFSNDSPEPRHKVEEMSEEELAERAAALEIEGHDSMLNDQLIEAIRKHEQPDRVDATRQAERADPESEVEGG